jgi:hypothetical protein
MLSSNDSSVLLSLLCHEFRLLLESFGKSNLDCLVNSCLFGRSTSCFFLGKQGFFLEFGSGGSLFGFKFSFNLLSSQLSFEI